MTTEREVPDAHDDLFDGFVERGQHKGSQIVITRGGRIAGVQTTLPFYRWLMDRAEFTDETGAGLSTDLIARTWEPAPLVASAVVLLELISNNFVEPVVYGKRTGLSPLAVVLAAVFWAWMWGGVGLILGAVLALLGGGGAADAVITGVLVGAIAAVVGWGVVALLPTSTVGAGTVT